MLVKTKSMVPQTRTKAIWAIYERRQISLRIVNRFVLASLVASEQNISKRGRHKTLLRFTSSHKSGCEMTPILINLATGPFISTTIHFFYLHLYVQTTTKLYLCQTYKNINKIRKRSLKSKIKYELFVHQCQ